MAPNYFLANLVGQRNINPLNFSMRANYLFSFIVFKLIPTSKSSTDPFTIGVGVRMGS